MNYCHIGFSILFLSMIGYGQSRVDIRTQSKSADFSTFSATKPFKTGAVLPQTCSVGEAFYSTSAPDGANIYACTATNTWTLEGGGGAVGAGPGVSSELGDLQVGLSGSTALTIGPNCTVSAPCNVRFGNMVYSFTARATATITAGTGMAYVYVSNDGFLTVGHSMTVACSSGCAAQNGIAAFPLDSIPLATWSATNGTWDSSGGTDWRAFQSAKSITTGVGLTTVTNWGRTQIGVDTGAVSLRVAVPLTSTDTCAQGSWAMDASFVYLCYANNQWRTIPQSAWKTTPGGGNLADPGANGVLKRIALNTTAVATGGDFPTMVGVGTSHSSGAVPDPGASGAATDYLARDATWKSIPSGGGGGRMTVELFAPVGVCNSGSGYAAGVWSYDNSDSLHAPNYADCRSIGSTPAMPRIVFQLAYKTAVTALFRLPGNWQSAAGVDLIVGWEAGGGNNKLGAQVYCPTAGAGMLPPSAAYNAATETTVVAAGTNPYTTRLAGIDTTGCSAGGYMWMRFYQDGTVPSPASISVEQLIPVIRVNVQ